MPDQPKTPSQPSLLLLITSRQAAGEHRESPQLQCEDQTKVKHDIARKMLIGELAKSGIFDLKKAELFAPTAGDNSLS
jgi:hypothetical protein